MNLREAMQTGAPVPMVQVGKIDAWLDTLDGEDLKLALEILHAPHHLRPDLYHYTAERAVAILAQVGVLVSVSTLRQHRRTKRLGGKHE